MSLTVGADSQNLIIRVADTGRGIPKTELSSIFEAFHQASNAYDKMGSGVGLALVKQVVTSMKGDVSINSTVGVGSTFTVQLPLRQILITQHEALREKFSKALAEGKEKEVDIADPDRHFLEKLDAIISEKMQQGDIDIESIASALCMSQKQLRGKVSSITGETPSNYIQHLRLNKACTLLNTTDSQIGEIAMQCGFDDSAYFSRLFKQVYGITPTQFRKHPI